VATRSWIEGEKRGSLWSEKRMFSFMLLYNLFKVSEAVFLACANHATCMVVQFLLKASSACTMLIRKRIL